MLTENKPNITEEIFDGDQRFMINNKNHEGTVEKDGLISDASYPQQYYTGPGGSLHQVPDFEHPGNQHNAHRHAVDVRGKWREGSKEKSIRDHEHKNAERTKDEAAHDKRKSNEKALRERTEVEFFERGLYICFSNLRLSFSCLIRLLMCDFVIAICRKDHRAQKARPGARRGIGAQEEEALL